MKHNTAPLFFCCTPKCSSWQTIKQNRVTFAIVFVFLLYFVVMDVLLYKHVQQMQPIFSNKTENGSASIPDYDGSRSYSPFEGLSVKMMMMDQPNDYVHIPMATLFNKVTSFSEVFYFITPNMISVASIFVALVAAKFVTSEQLFCRQLGVLIFEFRNFLDALDGAVFRSRLRLFTFVSDRNSLGGMVDGIADVFGFAAFIAGCYIYLKKTSPRKLYTQNGGPLEFCEVNGGGGGTKHSALKGMALFSFQIVYGALAWNMYIDRFHKLLETPLPTMESAIIQNILLKSNFTFMFMWIWRLINAHGLIEILALFIFTDKLWEFIVFIQNKGVILLTGLILFTELYFMDITRMLHTMSA